MVNSSRPAARRWENSLDVVAVCVFFALQKTAPSIAAETKPNHRLAGNSTTDLLYIPGLGAFSILLVSLTFGNEYNDGA